MREAHKHKLRSIAVLTIDALISYQMTKNIKFVIENSDYQRSPIPGIVVIGGQLFVATYRFAFEVCILICCIIVAYYYIRDFNKSFDEAEGGFW